MIRRKGHDGALKRKRALVIGMICMVVQMIAGAGKLNVYAQTRSEDIQEPTGLYARAAVLMDADSGRILFEKNAGEERAMASTTKIMTCIVALEQGNLDETVTVSANASAQPEVHLGMREGQQFTLRKLLYSLMLESHNDSAVAIAEHVGQSVEGFADMMNGKAKELGCQNTYFITPNGLDASDENGIHHTTAADLARIMKYCIMDSPQKSAFLEITRTPSYQFTDESGERSYSCSNHNAFLHMMDGALSGKTGFTSEAGYCYVGALTQDERTYVVALLACGWPNNKSYKWADTRKLMVYGIENFHYRDIYREVPVEKIPVIGGVPEKEQLNGSSYAEVEARKEEPAAGEAPESQFPEQDALEPAAGAEQADGTEIRRLLRDDEEIRIEKQVTEKLNAPVEKGTEVGYVRFLLGEEELYSYRLVTASDVDKRDFGWCFRRVMLKYINKND